MIPENKQNRRCKQINFIGLQNNRHPSQHTVVNVHKASGNCQQRLLSESIAEPLSHVLGLRPQAPDQVSTVDFFLFPRLKSIMKGAGFADLAAIQERVTAALRSIPKEAFADSFQKLYERCQQCVVKDDDYLEGQ
jgi:hypothetical protein